MKNWLVPVTKENWEIYKKSKFTYLAFSYRKRVQVSNISKGDRILIYIASRVTVIGARIKVIEEYKLQDEQEIKKYSRYDKELTWNEIFRCRIKTKPEIILNESNYINFKKLINKLEFIKDKKYYNRNLQQSLISLPESDYNLINKEFK